MKVDERVSQDVIDRRKHMIAGALAGVIASCLAIAGIHLVVTGSAADVDRNLVFVVSTALDRGQDYWQAHLPDYRRAHVVLYDESTATACGQGLAVSGPFYCPADEHIYLDLSFLRAIHGELARAYVIEHELGHHVQKVRAEIQPDTPSIAIELEADCLAGELMRDEQRGGHLDATDVPGALAEAAAVGDDKICPSCSPEMWTHGSSEQRVGAVDSGLGGIPCHL